LESRGLIFVKSFVFKPNGEIRQATSIITSKNQGTLVTPPKEISYNMVREFYANAYSTYEHPFCFCFCYTTSVADKDVHFDREIINDYIGNPGQCQEDKLCDYSRKVNQGNLNNNEVARVIRTPVKVVSIF